MSLLKYHSSIRGMNSPSGAFLSASNPSASTFWEECGCRLAGTLTSNISKGSGNEPNGEKKEDSNETQKKDHIKSERIHKPNTKSKFFHLSSQIQFSVPLRISAMNKYITSTSRKLVNSGYSRKPKDSNNNASHGSSSDDSSVYSLEKTITKMNQSILSFYDSTYVDEKTYEAKAGRSPSLTVAKPDILDDDYADAPRTRSLRISLPFSSTPKAIEMRKKKATERRAEKISRLSLESRTKALVQGLGSAFSIMSRQTRLEELSEHLITHPECVWEASNERVLPILLKLAESPDKNLKGLANQCLALMGHVRPLGSPGIRILSIDGGGTRGLVALEFLKSLEKQTGKRTHQLFDYVCGVSTGALLAAMICLYKLPLDQCEQLYQRFSIKTFTRNRVVGTKNLVWKHGFYDTNVWEQILKKEMGNIPFIEFSRDQDVPRMSAVSALVTPSRMTNFLFRTYNLPPGVESQYTGHCKHKIWEVIRASSAAPGYFEPFSLGDDVHEDGGILTNNPTALAIHESRLLWEKENFHCVLSLGTGRFDTKTETPAKLSLKRRINTIVDSACDTEAVHHTLQDLLPSKTYFRCNPYLSEEFFLDEIRPDKLELMQHDARMYNRRNKNKLIAIAERLAERRKPQQRVYDWARKITQRI